MGRRILLTGLDTFWGSRVAAALERDPGVDMLLGMGTGCLLYTSSQREGGRAPTFAERGHLRDSLRRLYGRAYPMTVR